jgi:SAM-dependent methyltransferase
LIGFTLEDSAMKQSEVFLAGEGVEWFERNKYKLNIYRDPVIRALDDNPIIIPYRVLEVGCADGWRLNLIRERFGCDIEGIDPGSVDREPGTADDLSRFQTGKFNVVIYGFCLYLCDREDLSKIVSEGDRVLEDGGFLIIYDFHPDQPHKRKYKHREGIFSYKMDYSQLWLANPAYKTYRRYLYGMDGDIVSVVILRKDIDSGWPERG